MCVYVCIGHFSARTAPKPLKSHVSKIVYLQWLVYLSPSPMRNNW